MKLPKLKQNPLKFTIMKLFFQSILRLIGYALLIFICSYIIELDFKDGSANEEGLIEFSQHIILLFCVLIGFFNLFYTKQNKVFTLLLSLFIAIHLIREFDAWFDGQFPALGWFPFVAVVLVIMLVIIVKNFQIFIEQINEVSTTMGFGILLLALAKLHIFTRIYGKPSNWDAIMGDNYLYQVERISEESVELVAYTMILIAMIELFITAKKEAKL